MTKEQAEEQAMAEGYQAMAEENRRNAETLRQLIEDGADPGRRRRGLSPELIKKIEQLGERAKSAGITEEVINEEVAVFRAGR